MLIEPTIKIISVTDKKVTFVIFNEHDSENLIVIQNLFQNEKKNCVTRSNEQFTICDLEPETIYKLKIKITISNNEWSKTDKSIIFTTKQCFEKILNNFIDRNCLSNKRIKYIEEIICDLKDNLETNMKFFQENSYELVSFGSFVNGFAFNDCDVDLTILTENLGKYQNVDHFLATIIKQVIIPCHPKIVKKYFMIGEKKTKVPLIKFDYMSVKIDLTLNRYDGINNTNFYKKCSKVKDIRNLGLLFKSLIKECCIKSTKQLNSYSIILMTLYYLQNTNQLQIDANKNNIVYLSDIPLVENFINLLDFYYNFEYDTEIIDINGPRVKQDEIVIHVADPFENINVSKNVDKFLLLNIKECLISAKNFLEGETCHHSDVEKWFMSM